MFTSFGHADVDHELTFLGEAERDGAGRAADGAVARPRRPNSRRRWRRRPASARSATAHDVIGRDVGALARRSRARSLHQSKRSGLHVVRASSSRHASPALRRTLSSPLHHLWSSESVATQPSRGLLRATGRNMIDARIPQG